MVTLRALIGARSEAHYECMYTKHKTQKRKTWHDGFISLTAATHKLVLYEDMPPAGRVLDEAKMNQYDWERRDEEYISVPKFLIEIINETPIQISGGGGSAAAAPSASAASTDYSNAAMRADPSAASVSSVAAPPPRPGASKFKVPTAGSSAPPRLITRPGSGARQLLGRAGASPQSQAQPSPQTQAPSLVNTRVFDFDRNPTSEWHYKPNAISRSVDEVEALFNQ